MKVFTDPQIAKIERLLAEIEKSNSRVVLHAEKIIEIISQAESFAFRA